MQCADCNGIWFRFGICRILCFPCPVCGSLPDSFCFLFPAFGLISRCKQRTVFYLCCNSGTGCPCHFNLRFAGNPCNWLPYGLVEHFVWLGAWLYHYMGTFLQRKMDSGTCFDNKDIKTVLKNLFYAPKIVDIFN